MRPPALQNFTSPLPSLEEKSANVPKDKAGCPRRFKNGMRCQTLFRLLLGIALLTHCIAAEEQRSRQIDEADRSLHEARTLCDQDAGALWGKSLCGPLLLVNPATRDVFANEADAEHLLRHEGEIFTGKLRSLLCLRDRASLWLPARRNGNGLAEKSSSER
jgi:hypothetical protein